MHGPELGFSYGSVHALWYIQQGALAGCHLHDYLQLLYTLESRRGWPWDGVKQGGQTLPSTLHDSPSWLQQVQTLYMIAKRRSRQYTRAMPCTQPHERDVSGTVGRSHLKHLEHDGVKAPGETTKKILTILWGVGAIDTLVRCR